MLNKDYRNFKRLSLLFFSILLIEILSSQSKLTKIRYKTAPSGIGYKIFKHIKGKKIREEDRCFLTFSLYHKTDTSSLLKVLTENDKKDFIVGCGDVFKGWDQGMLLLHSGDSAALRIPSNLAYGTKKIGSILPNSTLYLVLKVDSVQKIYFSAPGADTLSFTSGLKKILIEKGNGDMVKEQQEVTVFFTGYVYSLEGKKQIFESSRTNSKEAVYQVGIGKFVKGLEQGILTMNVGEKATFIVPPTLGYGSEKVGKILPNTTLYYDIELKKAVNPFYNYDEKNIIWLNDSISMYWVDKKNDGSVIGQDNVITYSYKSYYETRDNKKVEFDNSFKRNKPKVTRPGSGLSFPGLESAFLKMRSGEKATIKIPYKANVMRKKLLFLPENAPVYFDVFIEKVESYPFIIFTKVDTVNIENNLKYISSNRTYTQDSVTLGTQVNIAFTVYYYDENKNRVIVDCTRDNNRKLYSFRVGEGKTILGVEKGILGMRPGELRRIIIPPDYGYGKSGLPERGLPPNVSLIFDIEHLEISGKGNN